MIVIVPAKQSKTPQFLRFFATHDPKTWWGPRGQADQFIYETTARKTALRKGLTDADFELLEEK